MIENNIDTPEMPAGLGDIVHIGVKGQEILKINLSECTFGTEEERRDGFLVSMPVNDNTLDLIDAISEQIDKGNKAENLRIIVGTDGYYLDPSTMV